MSKEFYRFRPIHNLLDGFNELEKQTIYFAPPEQLNDPMEGYRDFFWSGDTIIWENLFCHYLFCLVNITLKFLENGESKDISKYDISVLESITDIPNKKHKELFIDIKNRFLGIENIKILISDIANRSSPVRQDELHHYLYSIHLVALKVIFDIYIEIDLLKESNRINDSCYDALNKIIDNNLIKSLEHSAGGKSIESIFRKYFFDQKSIRDQIQLIHKKNDLINLHSQNMNFIINDFPDGYLDRLKEIAFPDWYVSCFMSECNNSSVWGHYGDNHSGVCLIFEPEVFNDEYHLNLNGKIVGWGMQGPIVAQVKQKLHAIKYIKGFGEIDFFNSLGRLPVPTINKMWLFNHKGERSSCYQKIFDEEEQWRDEYWSNFIRDITSKSDDWKYESEYRIILHSLGSDLSNPTHRTLTYEFSSLKGLIFGINTKQEDKLKIIKIIERKCQQQKRTDFSIYQAYYCFETHSIKYF